MTKNHIPAAAVDQMLRINAELLALGALDAPTAADESRAVALAAEFSRVARESGADREAHRSQLVNGTVEAGTPHGTYSGDVARESGDGHRVLDALVRSGNLPDAPAEAVAGLLDHGHSYGRRDASAYVRAAGAPEYLSAFTKLFSGPMGAHTWTPAEREAFGAAEYYRAMSVGSDSAGGYLVPLSLDPAIMITNGGVSSVLRQTARVVTTLTDSWSGATSAGASADFLPEAAEVGDNSPTIAQPVIPTHRLSSFVPYSMEIGMDAVNFVPEMTKLLVDAAVNKETEKFVTGTGSGEPEGIITGLAGGSSVVTGTGEAFTLNQVYALQNALPPRFSLNASWMGNVGTLNSISAFETANGARSFPFVDATPSTLLRKPVYELSPMDGVINPAATEANHVLLYGDFAQGYVIVDRLGSTIEGIDNLFGPNGRPTGQRGLVLWARVGAKVVNPNAFRVLNVPTTA